MPAKKRTAKKKITEKRTGESYASRGAMRKHERGEGASERKREYGSAKKRGR